VSYLSEGQLIARVGGQGNYTTLTDDDGDGRTDDGVGAFLLTQVDGIANGYARRGGYTVPLVAGDVTEVTPYLLDIANYKAKTRGDREASEDDRKLYDEAIKFFEAIAKGDIKLPSVESGPQLTNFELDSEEQLFSRSTLGDF